MKRWLLVCLVACGGGALPAIAPSVDSPRGSAASDSIAVRCRTDNDACAELSSLPVDLPALEATCAANDRDACLALGLAFHDGRGVAADHRRALELSERACVLGHPVACGLAGFAHALGDATTADFGAAIPFYARACDGGDRVSCDLLGRLHQDGHGTAQDRAAAAVLFRRSCTLGLAAGCRDQGIVLSSRARQPPHQACTLFAKACTGGDEQGCDLAATECSESDAPGVRANRQAFFAAKAQCSGTMTSGCTQAGKLREGATGVPASPKEAGELYTTGCQHDQLASCVGLATLYAKHRLAGDPEAVLADACTRAVGGACATAAHDDLTGAFGPRDPARAMASLDRACAQLDLDACLERARGRRDGVGGSVDHAAVVDAFRTACADGSLVACGEGATYSPADRAWFVTQACFRDDASASSCPGVSLTGTAIDFAWPPTIRRLAFVGPEGHGLLASAQDQVALVDPRGQLAAAWRTLASVSAPGPRPGGWRIQRTIESAAWTWDDAAHTLVGVIATGGYGVIDYGLGLWSPAGTALPALAYPSPGHSIGALAISRDHRFAIVANYSTPAGASLIDVRASRQVGGLAGTHVATAAAFSADGALAAVGFDTGDLVVIATDTGAVTALPGSGAWIDTLSFDPIRRALVSVDQDDRARAWQLDAPTAPPRRIPEAARSATFSPDGRYLVTVSRDHVAVLDAATFERVTKPLVARRPDTAPPAWSPDSRYVAIATTPGVFVIDLDPTARASAPDATWFAKLHALPVPPPPPSPPYDRDGALSGVVVLGTAPAAGAELELRPAFNEWPDARAEPTRPAIAGSDGRYAFDHLPAIAWLLTTKTPDSLVAVDTIDLRSAPHVAKHDLALTAALTLRGTVVDANGAPAANVRILGGVDPREVVISDRAGSFAWHHVRAGDILFLHGHRDDGAVARTLVEVAALPASLEFQMHLRAASDPHVLRIAVVDARGRPVAGAVVRVAADDEGSTDARGELVVDTTGLTGDHALVSVRLPDYTVVGSAVVALPLRGAVTTTITTKP